MIFIPRSVSCVSIEGIIREQTSIEAGGVIRPLIVPLGMAKKRGVDQSLVKVRQGMGIFKHVSHLGYAVYIP